MFEKLKQRRAAARRATRRSAYAKAAVAVGAGVGSTLGLGKLAGKGLRASTRRRSLTSGITMKKGRDGVFRAVGKKRSRAVDFLTGFVSAQTGIAVGSAVGRRLMNRKEERVLKKDAKRARSTARNTLARVGVGRGTVGFRFTAARKAALAKARRASANARSRLSGN